MPLKNMPETTGGGRGRQPRGCPYIVRSGAGEGWLLLRLSVHDPVMPLNIESDVKGGCLVMAKKLNEFLKTQSGLDIEALTKFIL